MFSTFKLKAPANTKAAVRYNDLLKFKRLDKQYESIIEGDKIFIINLKENPYKLETVGLPNAKVPDEIEKFVKTYIDIDEDEGRSVLHMFEVVCPKCNLVYPKRTGCQECN